MVLGNFFLIAGINPQEGLRYFNEMYVDAYDWVMAANVLGMSLYADGGYMATKPYAATSTCIRKMSNYCATASIRTKKPGGRVPVQLPVLGLHRPTRGAVRAESADARDRWRLVETDGIEQGYRP